MAMSTETVYSNKNNTSTTSVIQSTGEILLVQETNDMVNFILAAAFCSVCVEIQHTWKNKKAILIRNINKYLPWEDEVCVEFHDVAFKYGGICKMCIHGSSRNCTFPKLGRLSERCWT